VQIEFASKLLIPERDQRTHANSATRGNIAGKQRDHRQQQSNGGKRQRIM
jgi:hypothetical protein